MLILKMKKTKEKAMIGSVSLLECVKTVLADLLGNNKAVCCDELARVMVKEWSEKGSFCPRLEESPLLSGKTSAELRRKNAESLVHQKIQRHVLLSHFKEEHCKFVESYNKVGSTGSRTLSYDLIVEEVNSSQPEDVLDYPPIRPGMTATELKKRFLVEEVIKIWWRQFRHPSKTRHAEFTNDEAWLEILHHWTQGVDAMRMGCLITPDLAPDCHWKFKHMKEFLRSASGYNWKRLCKDHVKYASLIKEWPQYYSEFEREIKYIAAEQEGTDSAPDSPVSSSGYGGSTWYQRSLYD